MLAVPSVCVVNVVVKLLLWLLVEKVIVGKDDVVVLVGTTITVIEEVGTVLVLDGVVAVVEHEESTLNSPWAGSRLFWQLSVKLATASV